MQVSYYAVHLGIHAFDETVAEFEARPRGERHNHPGHAAMTHELDEGVGRILDELDRRGLAEDTFVIFTSDNGSYLDQGSNRVSSNAPLRGQKASTWEGGVRVPLLVRGPGVNAGGVCRETVIGTDLYSTIAAMAGVRAELSPRVEGSSLLALLENGGNGTLSRRFGPLVWHFPHYQTQKGTTPMSSIRDGGWKLVKLYETGDTHLFDLSADIAESRDMKSAEPEIAARLEKQLASYLRAIDAPMARMRE